VAGPRPLLSRNAPALGGDGNELYPGEIRAEGREREEDK
jgi:hypothetical protein